MNRLTERFQRMSISRRVLIFASIAVIAVTVASLANIPQLGRLTELTERFYRHPHVTTNTIRDMKYAVLYMRRLEREAINEPDDGKRKALIQRFGEFDLTYGDGIKTLRKSYLGDQKQVDDAESGYREVTAFRSRTLELLAAGKRDEAWARTSDAFAESPAPKLAARLDKIADEAGQRARDIYAQAQHAYDEEVHGSLVIAGLGFAVLGLLTYIFARSITGQLDRLRASIAGLAEGRLDEEIPFADHHNELGEIGRGVAVLRDVYRQMEEQRWVKTHLASISNELQAAKSFAELAQRLLSVLAQPLGIGHGVFYIVDEDRELRLIGSYAYRERKSLDQRLAFGEGLVGQCALERMPILIAEPPADYVHIGSSLGDAPPRMIAVLPVLHVDKLVGVIELASFEPFGERQQALLDALMPMLAMSIEILERNMRTQRLLDATQEQAASMEEQAAQMEEQTLMLEGQTQEIRATEAWYRSIIEAAPDGMLVADEHGIIILANPTLEAMFGHAAGTLVGKAIETLVPAAARGTHVGLRDGYLQHGESRPMGGSRSHVRGVRADGTEFPVEIGLSCLPALGGRGVCVCASVRATASV